MKEAVHQLKENYDKQAIALTELTRLVIAMNLKYEQLVSKMGESDETSDRLGEFASQQQSGWQLARTRGLGERFFVNCFISGLKESMKNKVVLIQPITLAQTMRSALL
ncbi:hypothetical protein CICLE_v10029820mg [Citrus x clementina]|uniref:Uncharacterized protein n=1 Tax=Citrus clementina TaxID=85681 RepID=V4SE24_CITCL|nr:hypothetical protein CICLE_v10029820mg [Citrus x clementina]